MKVLAILAVLVFVLAGAAQADWTFDEIRKAIRDKRPYPEIAALESKHYGRVIRGDGYFFKYTESQVITGYDVQILEDYSEHEKAFVGDVSVEIPKSISAYKEIPKMKPGDRVSFSGRLDDIFGKTIFLRGSASLERK